MKLVFVIVTAIFMVGCTTGSSEPMETSEPVPAEAAAPTQVELATPITVTVDELPETHKATTGRIDAASFLQVLVDSGCAIDKAEYKEVARGGGISVTCSQGVDPLDTEGLDDL